MCSVSNIGSDDEKTVAVQTRNGVIDYRHNVLSGLAVRAAPGQGLPEVGKADEGLLSL